MKLGRKLVVAFVFAISLAPGAERKPNVIVVFTDDQGYADLGANGILPDVKTPNLDALAADGVRCTAGYITAPQCSPSRAGLITGRYQQRFGFDTIPDAPLPLAERTIAERLRERGYVSGQVGKWHLEPNPTSLKWARKACPEAIVGGVVKPGAALVRKFLPGNQGFDDFFTGELNAYWANYDLDGSDLIRSGEMKKFPPGRFRVDIQTDAALAFIQRNHAEPFFLYLNYYAPHVPLVASEKYLSRFPGEMAERRRTALAMISAIDDGVGKIRGLLDKYRLTDDTIIFYISDNGAPLGAHTKPGAMADVLPVERPGIAWNGSRNDLLTGEKGMLAEGGIRVPFLVSWPSHLPKGSVYDRPVISLDVAATATAAAGCASREGLDGLDLVPVLNGKDTAVRSLYWRFWNQAAVRKGKWKYFSLGDGREFLVDLENDPNERNNRISEYPDEAEMLRSELGVWTQSLQPAGLPTAKPNIQENAWYDYYFEESE